MRRAHLHVLLQGHHALLQALILPHHGHGLVLNNLEVVCGSISISSISSSRRRTRGMREC
jgi:hypothetical protein